MKKLLLWDIDGTLVDVDGAGRRAFIAALRECFGIVEASLQSVEFEGRTDTHIIKQLLEFNGLSINEENHRALESGYVRNINRELSLGRPRVLPGVKEILHGVEQRSDLYQGLLTGNTPAGAHTKMEFLGISSYFTFGGYGDEHCERHAIGIDALQRATEFSGHNFDPECVYVIGDTPHDIACGQALDVRTIAVATGNTSAEELNKLQPTALFNDFSNAAAFFAVIDG